MERLFFYLLNEGKIVFQAPIAFLTLSVVMFGVAYLAAKWRFTGVVDQLKAANDTLKERLHLKSEQTESYKDRALKYDVEVRKVVDADTVSLRNKAIEVVGNLREFIERHKREDDRLSEDGRSAMRGAATEEEKSKVWEQNINATMRLSNERNAEYDRRFRVDVMILRDELRSRIANYVPLDGSVDFRYEHPTNYFGFNDVASDLERMAKVLPIEPS